jgi:hypothetical protein
LRPSAVERRARLPFAIEKAASGRDMGLALLDPAAARERREKIGMGCLIIALKIEALP